MAEPLPAPPGTRARPRSPCVHPAAAMPTAPGARMPRPRRAADAALHASLPAVAGPPHATAAAVPASAVEAARRTASVPAGAVEPALRPAPAALLAPGRAQRLRVTLADGARTTVHLVAFAAAHTEVKVAVMRGQRRLLEFCAAR